ncbi:aminoglycoside phosphotransferase/kinase family protein [Ureibacillus acetophenoni]|uniref:Ser/Thr protein kinase RdoA (MazF antagonist) n=1 Tax=Ureibacillus acetophenoni TaxID=614649 RepID=A0A285UES1_9BACL|nr:hypothetical protein [Ureibacillus acetophenoni]SOC40425.1 hypothetical protein SAMN05877842_1082 [Ureibacillus acetophenoni]
MDNQKIIDICNNYYINPKEVKILRNNERVLAKIETAHTYYLKGELADKTHWEASCTFANLLNDQGFRVARYIQSIYGTYGIQYEDKMFSLEQGLPGKPIEVITDKEIIEIGKLLGIQHRLSMKMPNLFTNTTSWSMFGGNQTEALGDYDENELSFLEFKKHFNSHPLFNKIESLYNEYRFNLEQVWMRLPQGAVQGDFCYYNMARLPDESLAIYDFNIAGNEVYLNECIAVAVYHSWHAPYTGKLNEQERFQLFLDSYINKRPLNSLELIYVPQLKAIIRAFRHDRVDLGIALNNDLMQDLFVKETLKILEEAE